MEKSNNSIFVIFILEISKFRNIGRSTFDRSKCWLPPAITEHWTQKELAFTDTSSMWPVLRSNKFFSQQSYCDNLPLVTTSPGLPYS